MPVFVPEVPKRAPVPVASSLGERAWSYLPRYVRSVDDGTARLVLDSVGATVADSVDVLTRPSVQVDPAAAPFERLPWLAAMAGVDVSGVPDGSLRSWLADPDNYYRGNVETIRRRVGLTLTGARQVMIVCPHLGDPWRIFVRTLAAETPDPTATLAAIRAEVPAWLAITAEVDAAGLTYNALAALYPTYDAMTSTGKTYDELQEL